MLIDKFGRKHDYLRISLTDKCNLRCTYCMPENIRFSPNHHLMSAEEVLSIAKTFVGLGVTKIRLTGGEPLLRTDAAEIIASLSKLPVELAITTNGILVHEFVDVFKECGLISINLSLDTLSEEKFTQVTRRNYFHKVMENIYLLLEEGFHVKLNMVVMKGVNENEILDFVALTKNHPLHVRYIEFMPFAGNKWFMEKIVSFAEILEKIEAVYPVEPLKNHISDTAKKFRVKGHAGTFAVISTITEPFCGGCNRLRLTADGKMKNCLFSNGEADLLSILREGKDIEETIMQNVLQKARERGGIDFTTPEKNRSMVRIGG